MILPQWEKFLKDSNILTIDYMELNYDSSKSLRKKQWLLKKIQETWAKDKVFIVDIDVTDLDDFDRLIDDILQTNPSSLILNTSLKNDIIKMIRRSKEKVESLSKKLDDWERLTQIKINLKGRNIDTILFEIKYSSNSLKEFVNHLTHNYPDDIMHSKFNKCKRIEALERRNQKII